MPTDHGARPAAQQLLGKVGLLRTAAAATAPELRALATVQRDRAAPGRAGLPPAGAPSIRRPSLHLSGRIMDYYGTRGQGHDLASGLVFVVSVNRGPGALQPGRLHQA